MPRIRLFAGARPLLCQSTAGTRPAPGRHMVRLLCRYLAASLPMHGRCSADARPLPGRYLASAIRFYPASAMPRPGEAALPLPGRFSAMHGRGSGRCAANARPRLRPLCSLLPCQCSAATRRGCFATTWPLLCQCTTAPLQCYAATRPLPGRHLGRCSGNTRPPRGRYFDRHLSRHQAGALLIRRRHVFLYVKHFDVAIRKYYTSMNEVYPIKIGTQTTKFPSSCKI